MLIMMKRDWTYDLVPGSTRRTLPKGLPFDVAPEIAEAAIADGAAEHLVADIRAAAEPEPAPAEPSELDGDDEGDDGDSEEDGEDDGDGEPVTDEPPPTRKVRKGKTPAPAPAEPVEPE